MSKGHFKRLCEYILLPTKSHNLKKQKSSNFPLDLGKGNRFIKQERWHIFTWETSIHISRVPKNKMEPNILKTRIHTNQMKEKRRNKNSGTQAPGGWRTPSTVWILASAANKKTPSAMQICLWMWEMRQNRRSSAEKQKQYKLPLSNFPVPLQFSPRLGT